MYLNYLRKLLFVGCGIICGCSSNESTLDLVQKDGHHGSLPENQKLQLHKISPPVVSTFGGTVLTLYGSQFSSESAVYINQVPVHIIEVTSNVIKVFAPKAEKPMEHVPVTIVTDMSRVTRSDLLSYQAASTVTFTANKSYSAAGGFPTSIVLLDLNNVSSMAFCLGKSPLGSMFFRNHPSCSGSPRPVGAAELAWGPRFRKNRVWTESTEAEGHRTHVK